MIVFVEGSDGSGKSTLIRQLSNRYSNIRIARDVESGKMWKRLLKFSKHIGRNKVLLVDRSPLTELVYRTEDGRESKFNRSLVYKCLKSGKTIYCKTLTAYEDAMRRGEDNLCVKERHRNVQKIYDYNVMNLSINGAKILRYDWRKDSLETVINFIEGGDKDESATI